MFTYVCVPLALPHAVNAFDLSPSIINRTNIL